jgi:ubiquitin C-terminal hydrolase
LEYELIGVTVHTGTADGGHYYAFIRDRTVDKVSCRVSRRKLSLWL